jgi:GNAT superfamily N-acetyltransferase
MHVGAARGGIRTADPTEYERLRQIEFAADEMFLEVGIGPFLQDEQENHLDQAAVILVSGQPPIGFACVEIVDGVAHLWQLAVLPSQSRRGLGSARVSEVCEWAASHGYDAVTLTTFRDVPWNAPFYAKLGFRTTDDLSPGLAAIRDHEIEIGDDDFGPRVAMRKEVRRRVIEPRSRLYALSSRALKANQ